MNRKLLLALALGVTTTVAVSGPIEDQIRYRQSAYSFISWNTGKIKSQIEHPESFNKEQVVAAANAIAGVANSGLGALFGEGTDKGTGWRPTQLKSEFFQKPDEAKKLAVAFNTAANELARTAQSGDVTAIKEKFGRLGETCKGCHNAFRERE
jgi:cytochrome c556